MRIQSGGTIKGVSHVAFLNPDESCALVLTNTAREKTVFVRLMSGLEAEVRLPAASAVTLTWSNPEKGS